MNAPESRAIDLSQNALASQADPVFEVHELSRWFGGIHALNEVSFALKPNTISSVIGPNGAGKSTLINVVNGVHPPNAGWIKFENQTISGLPAHKVAEAGIARTFQLEELFSSMTVLENAMLGCHARTCSGLFAVGLRMPWTRKEERWIRDMAYENLSIAGLQNRAHLPVGSLPLGDRKMLGIARCLGLAPRMIMLDEPAGGLAHHEADRLAELILGLIARGLTVLLIEHNMPFVMSLSTRVIVIDFGRKIADGPPDQVKADPLVIKAYLGEEE